MNLRKLVSGMRTLCLLSLLLVAPKPFARAQNAGGNQRYAATAPATPAPERVIAPVDEANRVTLRGNTHPLARPEYDLGAAADSQPMSRMLLLLRRSPQQEAALAALLEEQQSKSSARYHQWLTPQDFGQNFGLADADIQAVTNWLQSHAFQVTSVSPAKTIIEFSGTAGQVRRAFQTEIHRYFVNGTEHFANSSNPQIPAALAPVVVGTVSLHDFGRRPLSKVRALIPAANSNNPKPALSGTCTDSSGKNPFSCYVVAPADFATIYNSQALWNSGIDGTGQAVAIVGDSNIKCSDVTNFRTFFGLPVTNPNDCTQTTSNVQVILNGPDPGLNGDEIEADLDVEWSGAVAKGAHIIFVTAKDTSATAGVDLSAEYIINNNLAPVMSESFGACESSLGNAGNQFYAALWQQAAAQGITAIVSTGDSGPAACDDDNTQSVSSGGLAVSGIASTPYNVAVGGTDFNDFSTQTTFWNSSNATGTKASAKSYIPEIPWDNSCAASLVSGCNGLVASAQNIVSASGGQSNCATQSSGTCTAGYAKPSWQSGQAVTGLASTDGARDLPDLSLFAAEGSGSNSFYPVCQADAKALCTDGSFIGVGGTSSSAPAFAGIMAMVNQYMTSLSQTGRQGNANYVLYPLASSQVMAATSCNSSSNPNTASNTGCTFYDITDGSNSVPCITGSGCTLSNPRSTTAVALQEINGSGNPNGTLAWQAGTGYDMATGLGSVNVFNLVRNWPGTAGTFMSFSVNSPGFSTPISIAQAGQAGSSVVTVGSSNGFAGTVTLTCSVTPANLTKTPTCSFQSSGLPTATATLSVSTTSVPLTLNILTTAASHALPLPVGHAPSQGVRPMLGFLAVLLAMLLFIFMTMKNQGRVRYLRLAVMLGMASAMVACGGGSGSSGSNSTSNPGTTAGAYTVTIVAASSGQPTQTNTITVNVQ